MKHTLASLLVVLAVAVCVLSPAMAQKGDQAEVQLKAAINKEVVDGDLKAAIDVYRKVAQSGNRPVAAKALIRMGQCYEKLGDAQAREAYERVVREYGDQTEVVAEARARLAALAGIARTTNGSTMVDRCVWAGSDVDPDGQVSPDGRFLSFTDWETGDLAVHDLATGENRRLTNKGSWATSAECAEASIVSPDSKQIVYNWYNKDGHYDLRIVGIDGSKPRVVYANMEEHLSWISPIAWSPDGRHILTDLWKTDGTRDLVLVAVGDGSTRMVKATVNRSSDYAAFSPDGRYIAYALKGNISLFELETGRESPLIQDGANHQVLGWAPDGRHILFRSDRSGATDAWLIAVANGKPNGEPERVKPNFSHIPLGFSRSGAFYYAVRNDVRDVHIAELDPTSGKVVSPPEPVSRRWVGITTNPDWSPDGRFLAYVHAGTANQSIVIRSTDTGEERELQNLKMGINSGFRWAPDGKAVVVASPESGKGWNLRRVDAQTGQTTPLLLYPSSAGNLPSFDFSPDGKAIFYVTPSLSDKNPSSVTVRDLQSGRETTLLRGKNLKFVSVSPDGQRLALVGSDNTTQVLFVMPAAGGDAREIARIDGAEAYWRVPAVWTPDGRHVVFVKGLKGRGESAQLWRVSAEGGEPERLGLTVDGLWSLRLHPDGRRVALSTWQPKFEVWAMENFLPPAGAQKVKR
jgi:Tol biopolymer transport system component